MFFSEVELGLEFTLQTNRFSTRVSGSELSSCSLFTWSKVSTPHRPASVVAPGAKPNEKSYGVISIVVVEIHPPQIITPFSYVQIIIFDEIKVNALKL
jgi:hypothetical protein